MWLLLAAGLTLLTGDVLSQANRVIYNETDLLALPSDQLIHSSAELLALEDQYTGLPFGAKLPGYETPLFAYSYTVKENNENRYPSAPKAQTHHKIHQQLGTQNVMYLDKLLSGHTAPFVTVANHQDQKNNVYQNRSSLKLKDFGQMSLSGQAKVVHAIPLKSHETKQTNMKIKFNDPSETKVDSFHMALKPSFEKHVQKIQHNSPQTQKIKEISQTIPNLNLDYLPPSKESHKSISDTKDSTPTTEDPTDNKLDLDYLPPDENLLPQTLNLEYLPPKENSSPEALNLDYLPPDENTSLSKLNLDYLQPDETISPQTLNLDYLPPDETISPQTLNLDYLPPDENTSPSKLNLDYLPLDENVSPQTLNLDYLPPDENVTPSKLNLDYLPPIEKDSSISPTTINLNLDYLPPDETHIDSNNNVDSDSSKSMTNKVKIDFPSANQKSSSTSNLNIQYISPLRRDRPTPFAPIPPTGIIRTLVPPVVDFRQNIVNDPITAVLGKKDPLIVIGDFKHKRIHQIKQGISKLKPLPVSNEFENKPISLISEPRNQISLSLISNVKQDNVKPKHGIIFNSVKPLSVSSGFVNKPITPISETKKSNPLSVIAEVKHEKLQPKHTRSNPVSLVRTLLPPIVEFQPPVINEAINVISVNKGSHLVTVSESSQRKVMSNTQNINTQKSQSMRTKFKSSTFRETSNKPIVLLSESRAALKPVVAIENRKHPKPVIDRHFSNRKNVLIGVKQEVNKLRPVPVTEDRNDPLLVEVEHSKSFPFALFYEHKNNPIRPISKPSSTFLTFADLKSSAVKPALKKTIVRPERFFKEIINQPIVTKAESPDVNPYAVVAERVESKIKLRKEAKPVPPSVERNRHKNEPIQPTRGNNPSTPYGISSTQRRPIYKQKTNFPPTAVVSHKLQNQPISPQSHYTKTPLSVTYDGNVKITPLKEHTTNILLQSEKPYQCLSNAECNEKEICQDGKCVLGCLIARHLCIGRAVCETRHHVPACVCPRTFTTTTVKTSTSLTQFDCAPMRAQTASNTIAHIQKQTSSRYNSLSYQRPIVVAPIRSSSFEDTTSSFSRPISASNFHSDRRSACSPTPCGDNTECSLNNIGVALCRCQEGYVPVGNTIKGCKPQCTGNGECPDNYECIRNKCNRVCVPGACGLNADCTARNHVARCSCPPGYGGRPETRCKRNIPEIRVPDDLPVDLCSPNPCGSNADCRERGDRPVCSCPIGYEGNPLERCIKGECVAHDDCRDHLACQNLRCIDPCNGVCGRGAECNVKTHQPVCSCPENYIGDPFESCRRITELEICSPTPCGTGTNCRAKIDRRSGSMRAVCSCIDNYIGNPLTTCRPECTRDTDCQSNQHCKDNRCRNPCVDGCGTGAYCDARNHRAACTCPEFFQGDPHSNCYPECTTHEECPGYQACYKFECIDPCQLPGTCGSGADCKVEDHTPICSCPRGYTGDPFISCRAFTKADLCADNPCGSNAECHPGTDRQGQDRPVCTCPVGYIGNPLVSCQRGDCEHHDSCPDHQACYGYVCQSPCYSDVGSVCGENAQCNVKSHQPVCSCPRGYTGNPIEECRIAANARIAGRSHRKQ